MCCTNTSNTICLGTQTVMTLCEMCSSLVGQDVSRKRIGYRIAYSVHCCPLYKCKNWKSTEFQFTLNTDLLVKLWKVRWGSSIAEISSSNFIYCQFKIYSLVSCSVNRELVQVRKTLGGEKRMGSKKSLYQLCQWRPCIGKQYLERLKITVEFIHLSLSGAEQWRSGSYIDVRPIDEIK